MPDQLVLFEKARSWALKTILDMKPVLVLTLPEKLDLRQVSNKVNYSQTN
jgi:hypothetical protein